MGALTMKYNDEEMERLLSEQLLPGESLEASVACNYMETGFFASRYPIAGYIGLTDSGCLVGIMIRLIGSEQVRVDLSQVTKLKIRKPALTGKLVGQREIYLEHMGGRNRKVKFLMQEKISGKKFAAQAENVQRIMSELEYLQNSLPGK